MPIKVIEGLPVQKQLQLEGVYTIEASRAISQDIRPLKVLILNLMPIKETTELQLLRLLGNTPLQIDVDFLHTSSHTSENTPTSHLQKYYKTFSEIQNDFYDDLIITGAPVEQLKFTEVDYLAELIEVMKWARNHVYSRLYICWGAQFALNFLYGIEKETLGEKLFGIFPYQTLLPEHPFLRGFDETYNVPQSRHTKILTDGISEQADLQILTANETFGPDILCSRDQRDLFVLGHLEYDRDTLKKEYDRDISRGLLIKIPENYYPDNDPERTPQNNWKSHGYLLYQNWLNETYQNTFYDLRELLHSKEQ
ncbi:homoserine O-succinyltransferase [Jeotgalibaca sp. A122]|uniref:homoserine O-succinyltransferase n=1 Tax=Jeotgalibaca sp. A122 TaxID=3457322 RepID=UPI003FD0C220